MSEKRRENKKSWKKESFYAKKSDVKAAFLARQSMILLLYKETHFSTNELNPSLPSVVQTLLQDYEDVFPNDLPDGLPPLRGIKHQIDFISSATIPNQPAYRSNPEGRRNFKGKLKSFMKNGYVRESISPCAVLVLLVPKKDETWHVCIDCHAVN